MRIEDSDLYPPGAAAAPGAGRMTREQTRANTRERLLVAARSVFARSGFHGASVDEIASEAGFSTGALYSNFGGKEDLFLV
ncbi:MAG: helix-turn-helix domain-containing protein, partial [Solirubrobacteraceae bacterium]